MVKEGRDIWQNQTGKPSTRTTWPRDYRCPTSVFGKSQAGTRGGADGVTNARMRSPVNGLRLTDAKRRRWIGAAWPLLAVSAGGGHAGRTADAGAEWQHRYLLAWKPLRSLCGGYLQGARCVRACRGRSDSSAASYVERRVGRRGWSQRRRCAGAVRTGLQCERGGDGGDFRAAGVCDWCASGF